MLQSGQYLGYMMIDSNDVTRRIWDGNINAHHGTNNLNIPSSFILWETVVGKTYILYLKNNLL